MNEFTLRREVGVRPLVGDWLAWPHHIPPASAALHLAGHQLPLLRSFVKSPHLHELASKRPELAAGHVCHLTRDREHEVRRILEHTLSERQPGLDLADALATLGALLAEHPVGAPLAAVRRRLPEPLRGRVELVQDRHHRPRAVLRDTLFYRSRVHRTDLQSFELSTRPLPFTFTTPLLPSSDSPRVRLPFHAKAADTLAEARTFPRPMGAWLERLGLSDTPESRALFGPPAVRPPSTVTGPEVTHLGHATVLIRSPGCTLLVDPVLPLTGTEGGTPPWELPDIDVVLLTHAHADHLHIPTLLALRARIDRIVVPRSGESSPESPDLVALLQALGFERVEEARAFEAVEVPEGSVLAVPFAGEHGDLPGAATTWHVTLHGRGIWLIADHVADDPQLLELTARELPPTHTLFASLECEGAPVSWLYGPYLDPQLPIHHDQARRLAASDPEQILALAQRVGVSAVRVYAMGLEPWMRHLTGRSYGSGSIPVQAVRRLTRAARTCEVTIANPGDTWNWT